MMKVVLIDDEVHSLESLVYLLNQNCPDIEIADQCRNGEQGIKAIRKNQPDIVFLDIEMPGMNGFEVLEQLPDKHLQVIFTTAYDHYAINAIKVSAMDYLLKPIDEQELIEAVQKASAELERTDTSKQLEVLLTNIQGLDGGFQKLAIPSLEGLQFIDIDDIMYCAADGNYTHVFTQDGKEHLISKTLKEIGEMLNQPAFFRTHQSYLVNLKYISEYIRGAGGQLILQDGTSVQVARSKKEALLKMIYK